MSHLAVQYSVVIDDLTMPITPEGIKTTVRNQNKTINLIDSKEYNMLKHPGLTEVELSLILPAQDAHYVRGFQPQQVYLDKFEALKTDKEKKIFPFMIIRSDTNQDLSDTYFPMATLEDYEIEENRDYGIGDLVVSLIIKQFEDIAEKEITVEETTKVDENGKAEPALKVEEKPAKEKPKGVPEGHTVVKGDTLWHIAEKYLGDGARYPELAKINPQVQNPNLIYPGQVINLGVDK